MQKLLTFFLIALLAFSVGWAETVTYTFTSKSWTASPDNWTGTANGNQFNTSGTPSGVQVTTGAGSGATVTCPQSYNNITSIVVNYSSSSRGEGNIAVYVGDQHVGTQSISKSQTKVNLTYSVSSLSGVVKFVPTVTTNSMGINSVTITYTPGSTPEPDPTVFHKVTSTSDLVDGQKYIIVYENGNSSVALGALNSSNVFDGVAELTVTNNHQIDISGHSDVQVLTLEQGSTSTRWALKAASGYIYGNNSATFAYESGSTTGGAQWTISENGIVTNSLNTDRSIRYYSNNSTFRHLTSTMGDAAYLYVEGEAAPMPVAEAPTFDPVSGGTFYGSLDVTISSATSGATIYYTTDGSEPTTSSNSIASGGTVTINSGCTIKAIAVAQDHDNSPVAEASYTKETLPIPTFSPNGGHFDIGQTIQVSISAVDGAAIYYTLDGTDPVPSRTAYTGPITISQTTTLKAISVYNGETSAVATAQFNFTEPGSTCDATISFRSKGDDSSNISSSLSSYVESGNNYLSSISGTNVYSTTNKGIRLGTGSNPGSVTLSLATQSDGWRVTGVTIQAAQYSSDTGSIKVTTSEDGDGSTIQPSGNDLTDYNFGLNNTGNDISWLKIETTTKRVYVKSITIHYECTPVPTLTANPNPLNINDTNEAGGKTGTIYVSGENLGGDNVGVTNYDSHHSTNFSSNPGYFSHNGTVTDYPVAITYTGHALSATGIVYPANNIVSTSVNINYLYTGPIYVIGDVNDTYWNTNNGALMTRDENGVYSTTVSVQQSDGTAGYITFTKQLGSNYSAGQFGPISNGNWWYNDGLNDIYQSIDTLGNKNNIRILPGIYTITVNPATNEFKIKRYVIDVTISPADGTTFTGSTISGTITDSPAGTIEWSTDGTNWQTYTDGFTLTANQVGDYVTIYARSTSNGVTSTTVSATYQRVAAPAPEAPSFSIGSSTVGTGTVVTITAPEGCTLYVDGQQVTSPYDVLINHGTTITAYCVNDEGTPSATVTNTYTISTVCNAEVVFKDHGSDATAATSWNAIGGTGNNNYFEAGKDYLDGAEGIARVYKGTTGLKFGNSSSGGTITFILDDNTEWKVSHITLNAKNYNDNNVTFTVTTNNGQSQTTPAIGSTLGGYTLDFDGSAITSITISSSARAYLKGFTITHDCDPEIETASLAEIESNSSLDQTLVKVSDELIGAWAVVNPQTGAKLLWAKDQGNASIAKLPGKTDGQRDYVKDILKYKRILDDEVQPTWDESNWVVLDFSDINDADPFEFVGHKITPNTVVGEYYEYSDGVNYMIKLMEKPDQFNENPLELDVAEYQGYDGPFPENKLGDKYDLAYNTYVPANFMTENHNQKVDGNVVGFVADNGALPACQGDSLYFVNPKIQEVAHIWAVWNGGNEDLFTVYETEHRENENINAWHLNGTFRVNWSYNCTGVDPNENTALVYGRPTDLVPNMAYEFHAVVMKPNGTRLNAPTPQGTADPGTPSQSYVVYPLDMSDGGTPTTVLELNALKTVVSVTYYNLLGVESRKPFEGINIVVTRYNDGSVTTQKVLR